MSVPRARLKKSETIDGYVVEVGEHWVVVAATSHVVYLDGWEVLRIRDISEVEVAGKQARRYSDRALASLGTPPSKPTGLSVSHGGRKEVLRSALESAPIVSVHSEKKYPDSLWVGRVLGYRGEKFGLQPIDSNGVWEEHDRSFTLAEISRVTIGGRYNDALQKFGDPRPE
ncbi:hypothetical protein [Conyzicola nivalis]|uniref:hypothetical protein n=1 Tax=Conyzicola nivalis TaxID=1477021 RepID=UPI001663A9E4|nr:hypothetical protein [Conyzicola nivalis]